MFRARLALVVTLLLAACGPASQLAPFTDARLPPNLAPRFWAPDGWAWGVLRIRGRPALRYGVASPPGMSTGEVVILTGYGETAEGWFETARFLIARNYSVWVLEAAGQGGSGRYQLPRDIGHAPDFEADIDGLRGLVAAVVRPTARWPVSLIASGTAAPAALAAVARGLPAQVLVLTAPGAAAVPAGANGWARPREGAAMTMRQRAQVGWMLANPDLRMGGPATSWRASYARLADETATPAIRSRISAQVVILAPDAKQGDCAGFSHCHAAAIAASAPYQLAEDAAVKAWLAQLLAALPGPQGA